MKPPRKPHPVYLLVYKTHIHLPPLPYPTLSTFQNIHSKDRIYPGSKNHSDLRFLHPLNARDYFVAEKEVGVLEAGTGVRGRCAPCRAID